MFGWNDTKATHRVVEMSGVGNGPRTESITTGFVAGTKVATQFGWRPVESVAKGDVVLTFDGGMQKVTTVQREKMVRHDAQVPQNQWPFEIPAGALGNRETMWLLADQTVMIESDAAEDLLGDPFALIPAAALEGFRGIHRVPPMQSVDVITLEFDQDEIVFANSGALFFCPKSRDLVSDLGSDTSAYDVLSRRMADALVELLEIESETAPYAKETNQTIYAVA